MNAPSSWLLPFLSFPLTLLTMERPSTERAGNVRGKRLAIVRKPKDPSRSLWIDDGAFFFAIYLSAAAACCPVVRKCNIFIIPTATTIANLKQPSAYTHTLVEIWYQIQYPRSLS